MIRTTTVDEKAACIEEITIQKETLLKVISEEEKCGGKGLNSTPGETL